MEKLQPQLLEDPLKVYFHVSGLNGKSEHPSFVRDQRGRSQGAKLGSELNPSKARV